MPITRRSPNPYNNFIIERITIRGLTTLVYAENELISLETYESMDGLISGVVTLNDVIGMSDVTKMTGLEALDIEFASGVGSSYGYRFRKSFRISGFSRTQSDNGLRETLMVRFTNHLLIANNFIKKPYTFKNTSIANIVRSMIAEFKEEAPNIDVEDTTFARDYTTGYSRPLNVIYNLIDHAASGSNNSCKYFFYEDRDGIKFKTLGSLKNTPSEYIVRKSANTGSEKFSAGTGKVLFASRLSVKEGSNLGQLSNNGLYGARTITHSLIRKTVEQHDIRRSDFSKLVGTLNTIPHMYEDESVQPPEMLEAQQPLNAIVSLPGDGFYKNDAKHTLGHINSVAQMESNYINAKTILAEIPGNTNITVGNIVYVDHVSVVSSDMISEMASGNWMIAKVKHHVTPDEFRTTLELVSDSSPKHAVSKGNA